jgi:hypothetical protein
VGVNVPPMGENDPYEGCPCRPISAMVFLVNVSTLLVGWIGLSVPTALAVGALLHGGTHRPRRVPVEVRSAAVTHRSARPAL